MIVESVSRIPSISLDIKLHFNHRVSLDDAHFVQRSREVYRERLLSLFDVSSKSIYFCVAMPRLDGFLLLSLKSIDREAIV